MADVDIQTLIPSKWQGRFGSYRVTIFLYWFQQQNKTLYGSMVWESYHQMKIAIRGTFENNRFVFYDYKILSGNAPYNLDERKVVEFQGTQMLGKDEAVGSIVLDRV